MPERFLEIRRRGGRFEAGDARAWVGAPRAAGRHRREGLLEPPDAFPSTCSRPIYRLARSRLATGIPYVNHLTWPHDGSSDARRAHAAVRVRGLSAGRSESRGRGVGGGAWPDRATCCSAAESPVYGDARSTPTPCRGPTLTLAALGGPRWSRHAAIRTTGGLPATIPRERGCASRGIGVGRVSPTLGGRFYEVGCEIDAGDLEWAHRGPRKSVCKACQNKRYRRRDGNALLERNRIRMKERRRSGRQAHELPDKLGAPRAAQRN